MSLNQEIIEIARKARETTRVLANLPTAVKNTAMQGMADALLQAAPHLKKANSRDVVTARKGGLSAALIDRLILTDKVIQGMAASLQEIAALPDPVGEVTRMWKRPNGLQVGRMRIPLGVIGIIYESRPNVTSDAAGLCLKAGNAVILRGGSEAIQSNRAIAAILQDALERQGIPREAVQVVSTTSRKAVEALLQMEEYVDVIIPRGGKS